MNSYETFTTVTQHDEACRGTGSFTPLTPPFHLLRTPKLTPLPRLKRVLTNISSTDFCRFLECESRQYSTKLCNYSCKKRICPDCMLLVGEGGLPKSLNCFHLIRQDVLAKGVVHQLVSWQISGRHPNPFMWEVSAWWFQKCQLLRHHCRAMEDKEETTIRAKGTADNAALLNIVHDHRSTEYREKVGRAIDDDSIRHLRRASGRFGYFLRPRQ